MSQLAKPAPSKAPSALLLSQAHDGCGLVHYALERAGLSIGRSKLEPAALIDALEASPSAVFLDARHDVGVAAQLCRSLRSVEGLSDVHVVAVTSLRNASARMRMYEAGADDCWPYLEDSEQLARRAMDFVRPAPDTEPRRTLISGSIVLDSERYTVTCGGQTSELTVLQLKLLTCLMQRPGVVVSYRQLLDEVWNNWDGDERMVRAAIVRLRRVLGKGASNIKTVRGGGYVWRGKS